jgi:hypothetical protein
MFSSPLPSGVVTFTSQKVLNLFCSISAATIQGQGRDPTVLTGPLQLPLDWSSCLPITKLWYILELCFQNNLPNSHPLHIVIFPPIILKMISSDGIHDPLQNSLILHCSPSVPRKTPHQMSQASLLPCLFLVCFPSPVPCSNFYLLKSSKNYLLAQALLQSFFLPV